MIRDAKYLSQFLGKKIAIRDAQNQNKFYLFPKLYAIYSDKLVHVLSSEGEELVYPWDFCESPYVILADDKEIVIK